MNIKTEMNIVPVTSFVIGIGLLSSLLMSSGVFAQIGEAEASRTLREAEMGLPGLKKLVQILERIGYVRQETGLVKNPEADVSEPSIFEDDSYSPDTDPNVDISEDNKVAPEKIPAIGMIVFDEWNLKMKNKNIREPQLSVSYISVTSPDRGDPDTSVISIGGNLATMQAGKMLALAEGIGPVVADICEKLLKKAKHRTKAVVAQAGQVRIEIGLLAWDDPDVDRLNNFYAGNARIFGVDPDEDKKMKYHFNFRNLESPLPLLVQALNRKAHYGYGPHEAAEKALIKAGKPAISYLVEAMRDPDSHYFLKINAAYVLSKIKPKSRETLSVLLKLAKHSKLEARGESIRMLGVLGMGTREVVSALLVALDDKALQQQAVYTLRGLGKSAKAGTNPLLALLHKSDDVYEQYEIGLALWSISHNAKLAVPAFLTGIGSNNSRTANDGLRSLVDMGKPILPELEKILRKSDGYSVGTLKGVCAVIGELESDTGNRSAALYAALEHQDEKVRGAAVKAMIQIGPDKSGDTALIELVNSATSVLPDLNSSALTSEIRRVAGLISLFAEQGADMNAVNKKGATALSIAMKYDFQELTDALVKAGAK